MAVWHATAGTSTIDTVSQTEMRGKKLGKAKRAKSQEGRARYGAGESSRVSRVEHSSTPARTHKKEAATQRRNGGNGRSSAWHKPDLLSVLHSAVHNHEHNNNGSRGITVSPDSLFHYVLNAYCNISTYKIVTPSFIFQNKSCMC